ncbi:MAG: response regulator, partial [Lewinella sp.]|nr:response regulator [Lewinella sp.]
MIDSRLGEPGADTSLHFLREIVEEYCAGEDDCVLSTYQDLVGRLERRFHLVGAIYTAGELAEVAQRLDRPREEAEAYLDLSRFHAAAGNRRLATENIERALSLFEGLGDRAAITEARFARLEQQLALEPTEVVYPRMEALLAEASAANDTASLELLHTRMVNYASSIGDYAAMERHLDFIETVSISDPIQPDDYGIAIIAANGRARLFSQREQVDSAEHYLQNALNLSRAEPSRWMEVYTLLTLTQLEWDRQNSDLAEAYLAEAIEKGEKLELHRLLYRAFELKTMMAEAEGRYAEALDYLREQHYHEVIYNQRSSGFNVQNYYLQRERDQLTLERENQELILQLREDQLRYSRQVIVLSVVLAVVMALAFIHLRRRKRALARQHQLIREQAHRLASLDEAKSRFFANISHELRTPLALLLGPIGTLLKDERLTSLQKQLLETARRNVHQLEQLVNEILDLRKLESGKMQVYPEPTPLRAFVAQYVAQFESMAGKKEVALHFHSAVEEAVMARIDRTKCRQLIYNLLSNACKYTPPGGRIDVRLATDKGDLQLEVADTGAGISAADLPHVFDRYFQTNDLSKPAQGGTGIGLALCREYARLFGGDISVSSSEGEGATFRIHFPVTLATRESAADGMRSTELTPAAASAAYGAETAIDTTAKPAAPGNRPTILIVEDHPELQTYLRLLLHESYEVLIAGHGQAALEQLAGRPDIELIISDLMMPVMDGFQLLAAVKADDRWRWLPFIMLTARADQRDKLHALRIGVDDYLLKPFEEEELRVRVANLLENLQARRREVVEEPVSDGGASDAHSAEEAWLARLETYVQEHLDQDDLTVAALAESFAMSESTLLRQLKRLTGLTPSQYLQEVRLTAARELLENGVYRSVNRVAAEVGYTDSRS